MNATVPDEAPKEAAPPTTSSSASKLIRRIHMFTGLFLGPWMLMYALSTLVMTHQDYVASFYSSKNAPMVKERELDYTRSFPSETAREEIGRQVLQDIGLEGRHYVSGGRNGQPLVINRQHGFNVRRITFDTAAHKLTIERQEFRTPAFLERLHRRRGYDQPYVLEDTWGLSVDVAVVTMVFWSLSGIWLWWELKSTRRWGALTLAAGPALFLIFQFLL